MKTSPFSLDKWLRFFTNWEAMAEGFTRTLVIALLSLTLALAVGVVLGILSSSNNKALRRAVRCYVELFQNIPLVIQIYFFYYVLPYAGVVMDQFAIGVLGVGLYTGAYISEVVRTGIQSIPTGQMEAAKSQGFTYVQAMRLIILPQAFRMILPPLTNQAVNLIKNTSVLAIIAGGDLMYQADSLAASKLFYGPAYVTTGLLYFILCFPLSTMARKLEQRMHRKAAAPVAVSKKAPAQALAAPQTQMGGI